LAGEWLWSAAFRSAPPRGVHHPVGSKDEKDLMTGNQISPSLGEEARLLEAVEKATGGVVRKLERHQRWRPSWTAEVEKSDQIMRVYIRGERAAGLESKPLRQEYEVLRRLSEHQIPVPQIYGWCENPAAILMEQVEGEPYEGGADQDQAKYTAVREYMAALAQIHALDPGIFVTQSLQLPINSRSAALGYFEIADSAYQASKDAPDPLIEFVRRWILRNVPDTPGRISFLTGDAPQFMMKNGKLVALIDLEMATFGDPMADLASMRLRDTIEPAGDLAGLYRTYSEASGLVLDSVRLQFHTVVNFICVPMISAASLRKKHPHPAFLEYFSWAISGRRCALEAIAQAMNIELVPPPAVATAHDARIDAFDDLVAHAETLELPAGFFRQHPMLSLAHFTRRSQLLGPGMDEAELEDMAAILGRRPKDIPSGERDLEEFVLSAAPDNDEALVRHFYRREVRRYALMQDYPTPINQRWLTDISDAFED
jgi:aminoglycoside phosphotransferase (APT) family kinase protein